MQIRIALDAVGGDALALPNIEGAYAAVRRDLGFEADLKVYLCGPESIIRKAIDESSEKDRLRDEFAVDGDKFSELLDSGQIEIIHCDEMVGMEESPTTVIRSKKNSSMAKCFDLVAEAKADAAVSAGNSGAMMAYGVKILKRLPEVKRPAIMCHFPSRAGITSLLDAGANVDCSPEFLKQWAHMGLVYMQAVFGVEKPKVAVLNIGTEETKGNELVKETHALLKQSMPDHYIGFVEGRDIFDGEVDVIVCDGFVGNVALKTAEGVAKAIRSILKEEFSKNAIWGLGAWLAKGGFTAMSSKLDYREYGAAPLIGLQGLGLIAHGSSDSRAMWNAVRMGALYTQQKLMEKLKREFKSEG